MIQTFDTTAPATTLEIGEVEQGADSLSASVTAQVSVRWGNPLWRLVLAMLFPLISRFGMRRACYRLTHKCLCWGRCEVQIVGSDRWSPMCRVASYAYDTASAQENKNADPG